MSEYRLPSFGADMEYGTLLKWHVRVGDTVKRGDVIADIETQKGTIEAEVFHDGVVEELVVQPPAKVPVGTLLARLRDAKPAAPPTPVAPAAAAAPEAPVPSVTLAAPAVAPAARVAAVAAAPMPAAAAPTVAAARRSVRASPLARRVAAALGLDLAEIKGTGDGGVITRGDVERASTTAGAMAPEAPPTAAGPAAPPVLTTTPAPAAPTAMRQAIAAAMTRSNREIPHYYLAAEISLHRAMAWLAEHNANRAPVDRVVPAALLLKAVALALHEVPELNGFCVDGAFRPSADVHVGVAISLRTGGLIAPAIHHTDRLAVDDVMRALRDLVDRARTGKLRGSELSDPTITVTNLGDRGVQTVFGVIYPPQVALVGFGRVLERPWAEGGLLGVRPTVMATLSGDHRVSDGHRGGLFLAAVDRLLQQPEGL